MAVKHSARCVAKDGSTTTPSFADLGWRFRQRSLAMWIWAASTADTCLAAARGHLDQQLTADSWTPPFGGDEGFWLRSHRMNPVSENFAEMKVLLADCTGMVSDLFSK